MEEKSWIDINRETQDLIKQFEEKTDQMREVKKQMRENLEKLKEVQDEARRKINDTSLKIKALYQEKDSLEKQVEENKGKIEQFENMLSCEDSETEDESEN